MPLPFRRLPPPARGGRANEPSLPPIIRWRADPVPHTTPTKEATGKAKQVTGRWQRVPPPVDPEEGGFRWLLRCCLLLAALAGVGTGALPLAPPACAFRWRRMPRRWPEPGAQPEASRSAGGGRGGAGPAQHGCHLRLVNTRTGRHAVRITNGTPIHRTPGDVVGGVRSPRARRTLSPTQSRDPGIAWVGGGEGWWMAAAQRHWRQVAPLHPDVRRPRKRPTDEHDGPTTGFLVDDIKLSKATTHAVSDALRRAGRAGVGGPHGVPVPGAEATLRAFIHVGEGAPRARATLPGGWKPLTATTRAARPQPPADLLDARRAASPALAAP